MRENNNKILQQLGNINKQAYGIAARTNAMFWMSFGQEKWEKKKCGTQQKKIIKKLVQYVLRKFWNAVRLKSRQ